MTTVNGKPLQALELSKQESKMAHEAGQTIAAFAGDDKCLQLTLSRATGERIEAKVPGQAMQLLAIVLEEISHGNPITLALNHAELTTIQAAKLMRVSRPHLVKLLEAGKIPFRLVGAHRRVAQDDVIAFMEDEKRRRKQVLKELIAEQERLGLYE